MSAKGARLESHASTTANGTGPTDQGSFSRTQIDRLAGLYVTDGSGALFAVARRDLTLIAADIQNAGTGPTTQAAANDDKGSD